MSDDDQGGPMRTLPITPQPGYAVVTPLDGQAGWHTLLADAAPPPHLAGKARVLKAGTHVCVGNDIVMSLPSSYSWCGRTITIVEYQSIRATAKPVMGSQGLPTRLHWIAGSRLGQADEPDEPSEPEPPAKAPKGQKPKGQKPAPVRPPDDLAYTPPEGEAP